MALRFSSKPSLEHHLKLSSIPAAQGTYRKILAEQNLLRKVFDKKLHAKFKSLAPFVLEAQIL